MRCLVPIALLALAACSQPQDEIRARGEWGGDMIAGNPADIANCAAAKFQTDGCNFMTTCPTASVTTDDSGMKATVNSQISGKKFWVVELAARQPGVTEADYYASPIALGSQMGVADVSKLVRACAKN